MKKIKLTVFNGSPKTSDLSTTMQYIEYIKIKFSGYELDIIHIDEYMRKIENDHTVFKEVLERIVNSDGIIWAFPVYYLLVPAPMKRFIELIFENRKEKIFKGKYSTAISTSGQYFNHTAHNYIHAISEDLGMYHMTGYTAESFDLLKESCRNSLKIFFADFLRTIETRAALPERFNRISYKKNIYIRPKIKNTVKSSEKKIVILTDHEPGSNLSRMIETYIAFSKSPVNIININDINIKGPCRGCFQCAFDGICRYKDDIRAIYQNEILPADAVIFAGTIRDRFLSSRFKMFIDRSVFNGHYPVMAGKRTAYMISGPLRQEPNLRQILESIYILVSGTIKAGIITDEDESSTTSRLIMQLARDMDRKLYTDYEYPRNFLDIAGAKMLRDYIYNVKGLAMQDHHNYKKKKLYDFPQKNFAMRLINFILCGLLIFPAIRRQMKRKSLENQVVLHKRILKKAMMEKIRI